MWTGVGDRTQEQTLVFHCLEKGTHLTLQEGRGHKDHLTFGRWWGHAVLVVGTANIGDGGGVNQYKCLSYIASTFSEHVIFIFAIWCILDGK